MDDNLKKTMQEILNSFPEYIQELNENFTKAVDMWRIGKDTQAEEIYIHTLEAFGYFLQLLDLLVSKGGIQNNNTLKNVENTLMDASKKLEEASKQGDLTMIADVVEYEIIPAIEMVATLTPSEEIINLQNNTPEGKDD